MSGPHAVVIGAGPNGLAGAIRLAQTGCRVTVYEQADEPGGGLRSTAGPGGTVHDECAAVHTMAVASPFLRSLHLERHGLCWRHPEICLAHPLEDGPPGLLYRSVGRTAAGLGADGSRWFRVFEPLARHFDALAEDTLGPLLHLPRHPLLLARFGALAALPASVAGRLWHTPQASGLFAGIAAHAFTRLDLPLSSAVGAMIAAAGHAYGWPVAEGGSASLARALVAELEELGGTVVVGRRISRLSDVPESDAVLLNMDVSALPDFAQARLPAHVRRAAVRYRRAPSAFALTLGVDGGIPWRDAALSRAGTVHLGGDLAHIARSEAQSARGELSAHPFVLLTQQHAADPGRSGNGVVPVDLYAHVPHGHRGDLSELVLDQVERFAPGMRARLVYRLARSPQDLHAHSPSYPGGDIVGGRNTAGQLVFRPRPALDPYSTGIPGVFLASASTPPGAGAHGMAGFHAAESALRHLRTRRRAPGPGSSPADVIRHVNNHAG